MGFYHGAARVEDRVDLGPVVTVHEYLVLLRRAVQTVLVTASDASDTYHPAAGGAVARGSHASLQDLLQRVRRSPADTAGNAPLGTARLRPDDFRTGLLHVKRALARLRRGAASRSSLEQTLCAQLEVALLLVVLMPISTRLGRQTVVRRLMSEVLLW